MKKRLLLALFSSLLLTMITAAQDETSPHAFYAYTWEGTWESSRNYQQFNTAYYVVSLPDGNQALQDNTRYAGMGRISPDGQKVLVAESHDIEFFNIVPIWGDEVQTLTVDTPITRPFAWSPDSTYFTAAVGSEACDCDGFRSYNLAVVDASTGAVRVLTESGLFSTDGRSAVWSPDGRQLAYIERHTDAAGENIEEIKVLSLDGSQQPRTLHTVAANGEWVSPFLNWLPDGKHVSILARGWGTAEVWHVDVQRAQVSFNIAFSDYVDFCRSTVTDHFIAGTMIGFELITPDASQPLDTSFIDPSVWQLIPGSTIPCDWSPDGTKLVLVYQQGTPDRPMISGVKLVDFTARQVSDIELNIEGAFWSPYWSHDSRMLALRSYQPSRDPNDVIIYDTVTMQQVFAQTDLEFITWVANPPA